MNDKELRPGQRAKFPWAGSKFGVTWTEIVNFNNLVKTLNNYGNESKGSREAAEV